MSSMIKIAHVLRKYNPKEWGGTETALKRLLEGLKESSITSVIFCPENGDKPENDPLKLLRTKIVYFPAFLTVCGISEEKKKRLISVGGNLMSFQLLWQLWRERDISLIHVHTLGTLAGICRLIAKIRKIPFVVSIHGGFLDLPDISLKALLEPMKGGISFAKLFNFPLRTKSLLADADAILTVNPREAQLMRQKYPDQLVIQTTHSVECEHYSVDYRAEAQTTFPFIKGKKVLLTVARIDPVKNQLWVIEQMPEILKKYPDVVYVIVGPITDSDYYDLLIKKVDLLNLKKSVFFVGILPPDDVRLVGLFQEARLFLLPSIAEPFGIVILEAWAAGTPVVSSTTSGAQSLINDNQHGWLFDLANSATFFKVLETALNNEGIRNKVISEGKLRVEQEFDISVAGRKMDDLYRQLIESKRGAIHK